ncbi:MAG: adenosine deaminase [Bacteriovoracaceae bacterium]|jgi:adenosine deaminase
MKKRADLHRHLDGSIRESTVHELALELGLEVPKDIFFKPHMDLPSALSYFGFTLSLLQNKKNITRVAKEVCEDAFSDGVDHLEVRFGPHLHLDQGLKLEEVLDSALEGLDGKAGLILCGLYGDDPKLIESFVELSKNRAGIVALDLAGSPSSGQSFCLEDYAGAFTKAAEYGMGRTVHAAEGRSPEEIITAVEVLHAQRIGHGVTLLECEKATSLVLDKKIVIEACPTSNLQCGVIPSHEEHPLGKWLDLGVKACLNTDNTFFSQVSSSEEHQRALSIEGMNEKKLDQAIENGLKAGFHRS